MASNSREVAESAFKKYERREAEITRARQQEHARHEAALKHGPLAIYCGWNGKLKSAGNLLKLFSGIR